VDEQINQTKPNQTKYNFCSVLISVYLYM